MSDAPIVRSDAAEIFCWCVDVHTCEPESSWLRKLAEIITHAAQARILASAEEARQR